MGSGNGSSRGENRVLRGGSWINNGRNCRSANRNRNEPGNRNHNIGFRLSPARHVKGIDMTDQIIILFYPGGSVPGRISEKQGPRCVSRVSGCRPKAHRMTA